MAMNFEALAGQLGIDVSPWVTGFARAQGVAKKFAADVNATFRVVENGARQISTAITAVGVAVGAGSVALVKLASNAEEAASKFEVVFKSASASVIKDLDAFADSAGRSMFKMRDMAADLGALIGPMGFSEQQTGKMAAAFAKLAVDVSSFQNVAEPDVLIALRSALVGEAEPMRRYGVALSQVKIEQEAVAAGLVHNKKELTTAAKAQAIFNIVMRETAQAQGDAVRTGAGYANQMRRLKDGLYDAATVAGNVLLPAFTKTINLLNVGVGTLKQQAKAWQEWATINKDLIAQKTLEFWQAVADRLGTVWSAAKRLIGTVRQYLPAFDQVTARAKSLYQVFSNLWGRMPAWAQDLVLVGGTLFGVSSVIGAIGGRIPIIGDLFLMLAKLLNPLGLLRTAFGAIAPLIGAINVPLVLVAGAVGAMYLAIQRSDAARATWERIRDLARQLGDTVMRIAGDVMRAFNVAWSDSDGMLSRFVTGTGSLLLTTLEGTMTLLNGIADAAEMAAEVLSGDYPAAALKAVKAMLAFEEGRVGLMGEGASEEDFARIRELRALVQGAAQEQIAAEREQLRVSTERRLSDKQDIATLRDEVLPLWDKYQRMLQLADNLAKAGKLEDAGRMRRGAQATLAEFTQRRGELIRKGKPAGGKPVTQTAALPTAPVPKTPELPPQPPQPPQPPHDGQVSVAVVQAQQSPFLPGAGPAAAAAGKDAGKTWEKAFEGAASQVRIAAMQNAGTMQQGALARQQQKLFNAQLAAAAAAGTSKQQLRLLDRLQQAVMQAMTRVALARTKDQAQAIKSAQAVQAAYDKAFANIGKKGVDAFSKVDKAENKVAADAQKDAKQVAAAAAAGKQPQQPGQQAPGGQGGGPNAKLTPEQQQQQDAWDAQQRAMQGDSPSARRARIAFRQQMGGGEPDFMGQVGGMANQLGNMMTGAAGAIGQGQAMFQQMMQTVTDPLQKLNISITSLSAQLGMATINHSDGQVLDNLRQQLSGLQHRRAGMLARQRAERGKAMQQAEKVRQQQAMQRDAERHGSQDALNSNLENLVIVGRRAVASPVAINIYGVNDIRQAVDKIQLEMKRRGWLPGHRNTLETRKMW